MQLLNPLHWFLNATTLPHWHCCSCCLQGVWGFIKASRKPAEAAPPPAKPQKPVPRKPDVTKPPSQR
jgi:hypothetical protein